MAPPIAGQLLERPVDRGSTVKKGDRLFVIDQTLAKAEVARADAALAEAKARHENLLTGKRPEELDVIRAQRREIEATLAMAETELKRQIDLLPRGFTTRQAHEQAESPGLPAPGAARLDGGPGARRRSRRAPVRDHRRGGADRAGPGQSGPGEEAAGRPHAGGARGRAGREHVLQYRRMGAGGHARRVAAAGRPG